MKIEEYKDGFYFTDPDGDEVGPFDTFEAAAVAQDAAIKWARQKYEQTKMRDYYD